MPRPALAGLPVEMTHPTLSPLTRVFDPSPSPVFIDGLNPVLGPVFTMNGIPATASLMSTVTLVLGLPVVLEGAVITCTDGYVGPLPVTGVTPNIL